MKKVDWVLLAIGLFCAVVILVWGVTGSKNTQPSNKNSADRVLDNSTELTQDQYLNNFLESLSKIKISSKTMSADDYSNYNEAMRYLDRIIDKSIVKEIHNKKLMLITKRVEKELREKTTNIGKTERANFAKEFEKQFLRNGHDVYVSVSGKQNEILNIKYILVSRPFVYNLKEDSTFEQMIRTAGFRKVILTDGHGERWELRPN